MAVVALLVLCNLWITISTKDRIFDSVEKIEARPVGMVLGTSKKVAPDTPNQHFENRLRAAAELYHAGKVKHLLVSGHRNSRYYDEPRDMIAKLKELGIPESVTTSDKFGFRTLDSVSRAADVVWSSGFDYHLR